MVSLICYKLFSQHYSIHQLKDILKCWLHPQAQRQTYTIKFTGQSQNRLRYNWRQATLQSQHSTSTPVNAANIAWGKTKGRRSHSHFCKKDLSPLDWRRTQVGTSVSSSLSGLARATAAARAAAAPPAIAAVTAVAIMRLCAPPRTASIRSLARLARSLARLAGSLAGLARTFATLATFTTAAATPPAIVIIVVSAAISIMTVFHLLDDVITHWVCRLIYRRRLH